MRDLKTIVLGTDFSQSANAALTYAIGIAKKFDARLVIVVVYDAVHLMIEMLPELGPVPEEFPSNFPTREKLQKALDGLAAQAAAEGVQTETQIKDGRAYVSLIQVARDMKAGMLIMGTRGLKGVDHFLIGSTAEQVVRMSPCPVLTVRVPVNGRSPKEIPDIKHILVPVDFSMFSQEAVECVVPTAKRFNAEVYLVHAIEQYVYVSSLHGFTTRSAADENERKRASDQMTKLIQMFHDNGIQATSRICEGLPDAEIMKAAQESHADLIVMGTHGRTGLQHTLVGSVAEKVVRRSSCPVMTVKSPTFSFAAP